MNVIAPDTKLFWMVLKGTADSGGNLALSLGTLGFKTTVRFVGLSKPVLQTAFGACALQTFVNSREYRRLADVPEFLPLLVGDDPTLWNLPLNASLPVEFRLSDLEANDDYVLAIAIDLPQT